MAFVPEENDQAVRACAAAVDVLVARYQWQLLERRELARRAAEALRSGVASSPERAAIYTYSRALHAACSGAEGLERQNRAYLELFRFLFASARRRFSEVAEEAAQSAIERTFTSFASCREPGALLSFALHHLLNAARTARRHASPPAAPLDAADREQPLSQQPSPNSDPAAAVLDAERRSRFELLAAAFLQKHPRAARQLATLRKKYIDEMDDGAIARELGVPVSSVYVLRSRAIRKLRAEPEWRALAAEFEIAVADAEAPQVQDQGRSLTLGE